MLKSAKDCKEVDVLIVGGGSTGCGAALDARLRGLSVTCIEREDFGSATSSRSTQLIWGGSRYLVQALVALFNFDMRLLRSPLKTIRTFRSELKLVMNCHRERKFLLQFQPHLTSWLPIAVPLAKWIQWPPPYGFPPAAFGPLGLYPLFFKLYDALSGFTCPPSHVMTRSRAKRKFPQLANSEIKYCPVFYEGQHNDARTNLTIGLTAAAHGAQMLNYCEAIDFLRDSRGHSSFPDRIAGVKVRDEQTGEIFEIRAKSILLCAGVFTDELRRKESSSCKPAVAGASGVHIVLPSYYAPSEFGLVDMNTSDGRFLFFLPWQGHVLVGTTDHRCDPTARPQPMESEIQWILHEAAKYLSPELRLRRQDVLSAWKGIRPLASDPNVEQSTENGNTAQASRDHVISLNNETGVVFVSGGKWTTYREMAQDAIDKIIEVNGLDKDRALRSCSTLSTALLGKQGYSENLPIRLIQQFGISLPVARRLSKTYGGRALEVLRCTPRGSTQANLKKREVCEVVFQNNQISLANGGAETVSIPVITCPDPSEQFPLLAKDYPFLEIEVIFATRNEWAVHAEDILARRTRLAFLNKNAAIRCIPRVVELMAHELQWSAERQNEEIHRCCEFMKQFGGPIPSVEVEEESTIAHPQCRMATNEDIRQVLKVVDPTNSNKLSRVQVELASQMLGKGLAADELEDCFSASGATTLENSSITGDQFAWWWNSDRYNPGLKQVRDRHITPLQNVQGSGTFFG